MPIDPLSVAIGVGAAKYLGRDKATTKSGRRRICGRKTAQGKQCKRPDSADGNGCAAHRHEKRVAKR